MSISVSGLAASDLSLPGAAEAEAFSPPSSPSSSSFSKSSQVPSEVDAMPRKRSAKSSGLLTCFSAYS
jgi:hypothetical protein